MDRISSFIGRVRPVVATKGALADESLARANEEQSVSGEGGAAVLARNAIWQAFISPFCQCKTRKKTRWAFCTACYYFLPIAMQRALGKRFGAGFEDAYRAAAAWLKQKETEQRRMEGREQ